MARPGAVWANAGRYHLFARGVRDGYSRNPGPGPRFVDYISDLLVFQSVDGIDYEFSRCSPVRVTTV